MRKGLQDFDLKGKTPVDHITNSVRVQPAFIPCRSKDCGDFPYSTAFFRMNRDTLFSLLLSSGLLCAASTDVFALDSFPNYWRAEFYHNHSSQQTDIAFRMLDDAFFSGSESVLDIGCGDGRVSANLSARVLEGHVTGIDISKGMIHFASHNHGPGLFPNLSFSQCDILDADFFEEFDFICSFSVLHWIRDHEALLAKIFHALRPDGRILFSMPVSCPLLFEVIQEVCNHEVWEPYFSGYTYPRKYFTAEEYASLLNNQGFSGVHVESFTHDQAFANKRDLIDWYRAFSPLLLQIPKDKKEAFLEDLVNVYVEKIPVEKNGRIVLSCETLRIEACKQ
jgi:trans-aconitate methyltransferase